MGRVVTYSLRGDRRVSHGTNRVTGDSHAAAYQGFLLIPLLPHLIHDVKTAERKHDAHNPLAAKLYSLLYLLES